MKTLLMTLASGLIFMASLNAEPVTLNCNDSYGIKTVDLKIDIASRKMFWGTTEYDIVSINDTFVTGYRRPFSDVGGEVWVINRVSGVYKRALVGLFYSNPEMKGPPSFESQTFQGKCIKKQF